MFACAERLSRGIPAGRGAPAEVLDQPPGDGRGEQGFAGRHRADGTGQLLPGAVLEQEAARAGPG
jgi:hypothetical protein